MSRLLRSLAVAVVVLLGLTALVVSSLSDGASTTPGSSLSRGPGGRDLALGLLRELGFAARPFQGAPQELPADGGLVILELPPEPVEAPGAAAPEAAGSRARDRSHYRHFVERGGVLVLPGRDPMRPFLAEVFGLSLPPLEPIDRSAVEPGDVLRPAVLPGGEELYLAWDPGLRFETPGIAEPWETALADADGRVLALRHEHDGGGSIIVFAGDLAFLDNAHIREPGCALLLARLAESVGPGRPVLFDEYVLGAWRPPSVLGLAFGEPLLPLTLHALALLMVLLARAAWAGPFPRDPERVAGASALARARATAALWSAGERWGLLASVLAGGSGGERAVTADAPSGAEAVRSREQLTAFARDLPSSRTATRPTPRPASAPTVPPSS